jgi:DNA-binding response OmpR family regulator
MTTYPVEAETHRDSHSKQSRSPIVLLAEDDASMRRLLWLALMKDGFQVIDACDGAELAEWIRRLIASTHDRRCVDLIIADQRMTSSTGLEVLAWLRHIDWSTPFILITAFGDRRTHAEAARLGASVVLDKPFDLDVLRAAALQFTTHGES